jgi:hypothetical protein
VTDAGPDDVSADDDAADTPDRGAVTDQDEAATPGHAAPEQASGTRKIPSSEQVAMPDEARTQRLTHALHWAQQGASPEVAQERWMRRLAGQAQQRLETGLTDDQVDDVAMLAAWVHSEAVDEGARIARRRMIRSAVTRFIGTVVGAAIGAGIVQFVMVTTLS